MAYKIRNWDDHFENAASRKLKRLDWVAIPNKVDGAGYTALVDHPNGAAHLGAWLAIVEASSRMPKEERGNLPRAVGKNSHDVGGICQSLGRICRLPPSLFEEVLPRLIEIGWIDEVVSDEHVVKAMAEFANALGKSADVVADSANVVGEDGATGKDREGQGREGNSVRSWKNDLDFAAFVAVWHEVQQTTGKALIEEDFALAHYKFRQLDFEQKLIAVRHVAERLKWGLWSGASDPNFIPKPQNYLDSEWKREVQPPKPKQNPKESQMERLLAKAREEDARNGIPYESD